MFSSMSSARRKSALAKAFDGFLNEAFGSQTTVTAGGRVVKKSASIQQLSALERIKLAQKSPNRAGNAAPASSRRTGGRAATNSANSTSSATTSARAKNGTIKRYVLGQRPSPRVGGQVFYPDDPDDPVDDSGAGNRGRDVDLQNGGRRKRPTQTKIDPRNRLLRPTVGFAAKHVDGAQLISDMANGDGGNGYGNGASSQPPSSMVKKAFRHLHEALTGSEQLNRSEDAASQPAKVSSAEFHRKAAAREERRAAKLERLRQLQKEEQEEVCLLVCLSLSPCRVVSCHVSVPKY